MKNEIRMKNKNASLIPGDVAYLSLTETTHQVNWSGHSELKTPGRKMQNTLHQLTLVTSEAHSVERTGRREHGVDNEANMDEPLICDSQLP